MLVPGAVFKQDGGNKIMALSLLRTQEALKFISTKFTLTMRLTLLILGLPPEWAFLKSKAGHLFFILIFMVQDERTNTISNTK